jgi:hypothetical protein
MEVVAGLGVVALACVAMFAMIAIVGFISHRRRRHSRLTYLTRMKQERLDATREQFLAWFAGRGVESPVAATVYDYVQGRCDMPDFPLAPDDPLERVCDIVVHEEIDDILLAMGYQPLEGSEWDVLDWDALDLPPPSEPDAPVASLVHLVDALEKRRRS